MPTAKRDFEKIKQDYLDNDIVEVKEFLVSFLRVDQKTASNGYWGGKTSGWRKQKENYRKQLTEKIQEKNIDNVDNQKQANQLLIAMSNIEKKVAIILGGKNNFTIDDLPKIKVGYELLRLATGQSTANHGGDKTNPVQIDHIFESIAKKVLDLENSE